ncbi:MAG TPA: pyridoxal-phosphate dependent enzyme [Polyangia bacterium]|jgi:threonine dehydratase
MSAPSNLSNPADSPRASARARHDDPSLAPDGLIDPTLLAAAAARVRGALPETPLIRSERLGAWLKLENLQTTGAYKVRGAFNALAVEVARGRRGPVFAASAGNHGLGVAWAARRLGLAATVVVPDGASRTKVAGCRAFGARVVHAGDGFERCVARARALAAAAGGHFLHAFDDAAVIAGQSTVAAELLAARPDVVVVPVGGGGLVAGVGSVLRRHGIRVVGVQVAGVDSLRRALAGERPPAPLPLPAPTLADGLRVSAPGRLPLRIAAAFLDEIVIVTETEVRAAVASLALQERVIAEGAGAVAVAALARVGGRRRVAIVSGGNIDAALLARLIASSPPRQPRPARGPRIDAGST